MKTVLNLEELTFHVCLKTKGVHICTCTYLVVFSAAMCELSTAISQVVAGHLAALCLVRL